MPRLAPSAVALSALCLAPFLTAQTTSAPAQLKIDPATIVHPVSPTLYGMMTEEINHAFDGGLYAELLSNRTFRPIFYGIEHWEIVRNGNAATTLETDRTTGPSTALPTSLKVSVTKAAPGSEAGGASRGDQAGVEAHHVGVAAIRKFSKVFMALMLAFISSIVLLAVPRRCPVYRSNSVSR